MFRYTLLLYLCCCWLASPSLCHRKKKIKHLLGLMIDKEHRTTHAPYIPHAPPRPSQPAPGHHHFNMVMAPDEQPAPSKVVSSSSSLGKEYEGSQKPVEDNEENHQSTTEKTHSTVSEYGNGNEGNGYGNNGNGYWNGYGNGHGNDGSGYNNNNGENGYGFNYGTMGNSYGGNNYKNNNGYSTNEYDNGQNGYNYNGNGNGHNGNGNGYYQQGNGNGYNNNGYEDGRFKYGKNHGNGYTSNTGYQYGNDYNNGYQNNNNYQFNKNYYNNDNYNNNGYYNGQNNYDYGKSYNYDHYKDYDSHGGYGGYTGHGNSEGSYQRDGYDYGEHSGGIISRFSNYMANLFSDPGSVLVTAAALSLKALVLNLVLVAMNRTGRRKRDLPLRGGIYSASEALDELMKQMRNYVQDANAARVCLDRIACGVKNKLVSGKKEVKRRESKLQFELPFVFNVSGVNFKSHYEIEKNESKCRSLSSSCPWWLFNYFHLLPKKWLKQLIKEYNAENGT